MKLNSEQLSEFDANPNQPVPVEDGDGRVICYMVTPAALANLQALRAKIEAGQRSPDVPAEEAHAKIRQMAADAANRYA